MTDTAPAYQLFDVVQTLVNVTGVSGRTMPAGTPCTIVEIFDAPQRAYMVEFEADDDLTLPILQPHQIAPWQASAKDAGQDAVKQESQQPGRLKHTPVTL